MTLPGVSPRPRGAPFAGLPLAVNGGSSASTASLPPSIPHQNRLVHGVGVDLAAAVAVEGCPDVAEQPGQLRLMVGAHAFAGGAPFGFGAHDRDGTVSGPDAAWGHHLSLTRRADQPVPPCRICASFR